VKVDLAVTVVGDVFNATYFNPRSLHDPLDGADIFVGRGISLDPQTGFGRFDHTGVGRALQFLAAGGSANIGGAQVKCLSAEVDLDAIEVFRADNFCPHNVRTAGDRKSTRLNSSH